MHLLPLYFAHDCRLYGRVEVNDNEKEALLLPPKFGLFEEIDIKKCRIQLEESVNKLRWNKLFGKREVKQSQLFDSTTKVMDINNLRVTTLPFNPSVRMPGSLKRNEEIKVARFKDEVMQEAKKLRKSERKCSNLTENEKMGLQSLQEKVKKNEIVCCVTDKSGKWACDTIENYKTACMNELDAERSPEIDLIEHEQGERELNCHAAALLRMMGLEDGKGTSGERLRWAVQAEGTGLAPFYGLRKDHKVTVDEEKGPRVRPLCGAKECSTRRASYLLCKLLTPLIGRSDTHCGSTDQLLHKIERVNIGRDADPRWIVGSLDVVSLYPSLDIDVCAVGVALALIVSDIQFDKLRWSEIGLYLRYESRSVRK